LIPRRQGGGNTRIALVGTAADQADAWGRVPVQRELRLLQGLQLGQLSARSLLSDTTLTGISRVAATVAALSARSLLSDTALTGISRAATTAAKLLSQWHRDYQRQQDHLDLYGSRPQAAPTPDGESDVSNEDAL